MGLILSVRHGGVPGWVLVPVFALLFAVIALRGFSTRVYGPVIDRQVRIEGAQVVRLLLSVLVVTVPTFLLPGHKPGSGQLFLAWSSVVWSFYGLWWIHQNARVQAQERALPGDEVQVHPW